MKLIARFVLLLAGFLMLTGCQSISPPLGEPRTPGPRATKTPILPAGETNAAALAGKWHSIIVTPPAGKPKISASQKFNPIWWFKNADEPVPPVWYRPDNGMRTFLYGCRNPMHNFHSYVIGISDKEFVRSGRYPETIANPNGGWNFTVSKYKVLRLPMISYRRGKFDFYFGWRTTGSFGIKVNFSAGPKPKERERAMKERARKAEETTAGAAAEDELEPGR